MEDSTQEKIDEFLGDAVAAHAKAHPGVEALVFEDTRLSYAELDRRVNRLARGLRAHGFKPGDHVAILMENCHEYLEAYYALSRAGLVAVPLNWRLAAPELQYIVEHSQACGLIAGARHRGLGAELVRGADLATLIAVGFEAPLATAYESLAGRGDGSPLEPSGRSCDDMVVLMYTGGTSGKPKGVMLSHRNLLAAARAIAGRGMEIPGARTLFALPFFHIANWQAFLFHLMGGCVVVSRSASAREILALLQSERPMMVNLVPTVYESLLQLPGIEDVDLSFVSRFTTSGAPMSPETARRCSSVLKMRFGKGYGLTEAAPAVSSLGPEEYALEGDPVLVRRAASVGKPFANVKVRIRRPDGSECAAGESGEVTVAGDNVMIGYWRDPERTRSALRDGWLWTGDVGYFDEDGYLYLVDRKSDMILSGGENVYPTETENVLSEHSAVLESSVVGIPDQRWGEAVAAAVVLRPGASATVEELSGFCRERIAAYKCPKRIVFVDELPKSTVGKVLRRKVREFFAGEAVTP